MIVQQVLFCYEPYDELVLMQLQQFDKKTVTSVEKEMRSGPAEETVVTDETLELKEQTELTDWVKVDTWLFFVDYEFPSQKGNVGSKSGQDQDN